MGQSPSRASVGGWLALDPLGRFWVPLLLRALPAIAQGTNPVGDESPRIIIDMPRPDRD